MVPQSVIILDIETQRDVEVRDMSRGLLFLSLPKRPEPVLKIADKHIQCTLGIVGLLASAEIL